jgi:hypothetical protein
VELRGVFAARIEWRFEYGNVCMISMLGDIAIRNKGMKLHWEAKSGKFKEPEGNKFLQREYRKGWELPA